MSDKQPLVQPPPVHRAPLPQQGHNALPPHQPYTSPAYGGYHHQAVRNNNVIVTQPAPVHTYRTQAPGDHYLSLSIFLSICCFCCGTWFALFCTIPAILFASNARDADVRGDQEAVERNRCLALLCNMGGIASYAVVIVILVVVFAASGYFQTIDL